MRKATGCFAGAVKRCRAVDEHFLTVTPHDLRHTAASAGANVKVVQRMLGQASAAMKLDQYADLFDADLDTVSTRLEAAIATLNDWGLSRMWPNCRQTRDRANDEGPESSGLGAFSMG